MAMNLSVVKPLATTNQILNPSGESASVGTTYWSATDGGAFISGGAATVTRDPGPAGGARAGAWCIKVVTSAGGQGVVATMTALGLTNGATYAVSFWIYNQPGAAAALFCELGNESTGRTWGSVVATADGVWEKKTFLATPTETVPAANLAATVGAVLVFLRPSFLAPSTFYIDGVQVELASAVSTYCDGDQPGCYWQGLPHGSMSSRYAQSGDGGQIIKIAPAATPGAAWPYLDSFLDMPGGGMEPVSNVALSRGLVGGQAYQTTVRRLRPFHIVGSLVGGSLDNLHTKRQNLIDLFKPDLVAAPQTTVLRYDVGGKALNVRAKYRGGLEFGNLQGFGERVDIQFEAFEPWYFEDYDAGAPLAANGSLAASNGILQRSALGAWSKLGSGIGAAAAVYGLAADAKKNIYAVGSFAGMGGVANTGGVAKWDGTQWNALGTGMPAGGGNLVNCVAVDANGNVYVGGIFANMGGVANTANLAKWNGSAWVSITPSGGPNASVTGLALDASGNLYVCGIFTTINGQFIFGVVKYDGSTWSALGGGFGITGTAGQVWTALADQTGNIYACGNFIDAYNPLVNIASSTNASPIAITTSSPHGLSTGAHVSITGHLVNTNANGYWTVTVTGGSTFTLNVSTGNGVGGATGAVNLAITVNDIARWNGSSWSALGVGISAGLGWGPRVMKLSTLGDLYVGGGFNLAGGNTCINIARWNGNGWYPLGNGAGVAGAVQEVRALEVDALGRIYVGGNFTTANGGIIPAPGGVAVWNGGGWTAADIVPAAGAKVYSLLFLSGPNTLTVGFDQFNLAATTPGSTVMSNPGTAYASPKFRFTGPGNLYSIVNYTTGDCIYLNLSLNAGEIALLDLTQGSISFYSNFRGNVLYSVIPGSNLATWKLLPGNNTVVLFADSTVAVDTWYRPQYHAMDGVL